MALKKKKKKKRVSRFLPEEKRNIRIALCAKNASLREEVHRVGERGEGVGERERLIRGLEGKTRRKKKFCFLLGRQSPTSHTSLPLGQPAAVGSPHPPRSSAGGGGGAHPRDLQQQGGLAKGRER